MKVKAKLTFKVTANIDMEINDKGDGTSNVLQHNVVDMEIVGETHNAPQEIWDTVRKPTIQSIFNTIGDYEVDKDAVAALDEKPKASA